MNQVFTKIGFFSLLFLLLASCEKEVIPNETFYLEFEESVTIKDDQQNFNITYSKLVEDSRCPEDAICVWAGRAVIQIKDQDNKVYDLGIGDLEAGGSTYVNEVEINSLNFKLLDVSYKKKAEQGEEKKSRIKLEVRKK
ncbi:MAG: hypothetical protein RLZZ337_859 [Bacteroidota bacterium]|jgi:hypothetical protein